MNNQKALISFVETDHLFSQFQISWPSQGIEVYKNLENTGLNQSAKYLQLLNIDI